MDLIYSDCFLLGFLNTFKHVDGRKRIQKLIYLVNKKYNEPIPFDYEIYLYGPYSIELQNSLIRLTNLQLVKESIINKGLVKNYSYDITPTGSFIFKMLSKKVPLGVTEVFNKLYKEYSETATNKIVEEVYEITGIKNYGE